MKKPKLFMFIVAIFATGLQIFAQQGGTSPERFYNVISYKANITVTFQYQLLQSEPEYSESVNVSQNFQHFFTTAPGEITPADMFQIEREDKDESNSSNNTSQEGGGVLEGYDMDAISQALENSGVDPSVMDMLKQTQKETESYNMGLNNYKMWKTDPVSGGSVRTSVYTKYSREESGTIACGEGLGLGPFKYAENYTGSAHGGSDLPDVANPNSFLLQLNLANNSYSFLASVEMPDGFEFIGNDHSTQCTIVENKPISRKARPFISIRKAGEGLIYKKSLPGGGMVLSGTEIIPDDRFNIDAKLKKEGNWSVRVDWTIFPADMDMPDVFISYKNEEKAKDWLPTDANNIVASMEWDGNYKPEVIEWELSNVSAEPGTCLNSEDKNEEFDLEFAEPLKENGYDIVKTETGYIARKEGNDEVGREAIIINSRDFGSYGYLFGKIRVNGIWCEAVHKELGNNYLAVPMDKNENHIADAWEQFVGISDPSYLADDENTPELDGIKGDGLSLYEEYRGLMVKGAHERLDPNVKELIVQNSIGDVIQPGLDLFESASKIKVIVLEEGELPESRIVNSNYSTGHVLDQYGVVFKKGNFPENDFTIAGAYPLETLNKTPKKTQYILVNESVFNINTANTTAGNNPGGDEISEEDKCNLSVTSDVFNRFRNETIAHELGHAVGANHHGDVDAYGETLSNISIDRTAFDLKGDTIKTRPLKICSPVGKEHGQASGSMSCLMRYNNLYLWRYESSKTGTIDYYQIKDEVVLNTFCTSDAGGSNPFGDATPGQGNCLGRLRIKDN